METKVVYICLIVWGVLISRKVVAEPSIRQETRTRNLMFEKDIFALLSHQGGGSGNSCDSLCFNVYNPNACYANVQGAHNLLKQPIVEVLNHQHQSPEVCYCSVFYQLTQCLVNTPSCYDELHAAGKCGPVEREYVNNQHENGQCSEAVGTLCDFVGYDDDHHGNNDQDDHDDGDNSYDDGGGCHCECPPAHPLSNQENGESAGGKIPRFEVSNHQGGNDYCYNTCLASNDGSDCVVGVLSANVGDGADAAIRHVEFLNHLGDPTYFNCLCRSTLQFYQCALEESACTEMLSQSLIDIGGCSAQDFDFGGEEALYHDCYDYTVFVCSLFGVHPPDAETPVQGCDCHCENGTEH